MTSANIALQPGGDTQEIGGATEHPVTYGYDGLRFNNAINNPDYVAFFDHFLGDTLSAEWDTDVSTGATVAVLSAANGTVRFDTAATDNGHATLALGLHWTTGSDFLIAEARFASATTTVTRAIEVGISDAVSETNGLAFSSHDATPVAVATDAVVFGFNTDDTMTAWSAISVNDGGTPQQTDTAIALTADTFQKLRIVVNQTGDAIFYIDGTEVARHLLAVNTAVLVSPWVTLKTLAATTAVADVDYQGILIPS
jgi:hypothetical protein